MAYTSILRADTSPLGLLATEHKETESLIRASGVPFALLRHSWYIENYTASIANILTQGAVYGCAYSIDPTSVHLFASGGTGTVGVTAGSGCAWTAASDTAWITVTGGASGTGNGTVSYAVAVNTGAARIGAITIASEAFTVYQGALPDGDLDGNGVSASDALRALRIAAGLVTATAAEQTHGDVASLLSGTPLPDGKIDFRDVAVILRRVVGLISW